MGTYRLQRVANLLKENLSALIITGKVKDPRVSRLLTIVRVKVAEDLQSALVFVSSIENDDILAESVAALNHAAGFIQKQLGPKLRLRHLPRLTFKVDRSLKEGFEMNRKLEEMDA